MAKSKLNFIASVESGRIADMEVIAKNLAALGCHIDNVLPFSGIIVGSTSSVSSLNDLMIEGVKHIEPDRDVKSL